MFSKLLVPLDGSRLAEQALGPAASIARATRAQLELVIVHQALAFSDFADAPPQPDASPAERAYVTRTAEELARGASVAVSGVTLRGAAAEAICEHATVSGTDLIVMTSHGRTGLSRMWLGSIANDILRRTSVPVFVLRPAIAKRAFRRKPPLVRSILVTLDGSPLAEAILSPASELARAFDARMMLLRVVEPVPLVLPEVELPARDMPRDEDATARAVDAATVQLASVARQLESTRVRVETHVVVAPHVANAILDFSRAAAPSVIAMSTHGRGLSRLFLGSVADKVLRGSRTPMLLRRPSSRST